IYFTFLDRKPEHVERAKEAVDRLAALAPDLAETRLAQGYYAYWGFLDYPRALEEFKAALALRPSSSDALHGIGFVLRRQGQWEEAASWLLKWVELDPRDPLALQHCGTAFLMARRYAEAERYYGLSTTFNPKYGQSQGQRGWLQVVWHGDADRAE